MLSTSLPIALGIRNSGCESSGGFAPLLRIAQGIRNSGCESSCCFAPRLRIALTIRNAGCESHWRFAPRVANRTGDLHLEFRSVFAASHYSSRTHPKPSRSKLGMVQFLVFGPNFSQSFPAMLLRLVGTADTAGDCENSRDFVTF